MENCVVGVGRELRRGGRYLFFFNDTAPTEIYTLSLHDALPIYDDRGRHDVGGQHPIHLVAGRRIIRSEEHTSELQSPSYLVCRLLLEKNNIYHTLGGMVAQTARGWDSVAGRHMR